MVNILFIKCIGTKCNVYPVKKLGVVYFDQQQVLPMPFAGQNHCLSVLTFLSKNIKR